MSETCSNCKFWTQAEEEEAEYPFGNCSCDKFIYDYEDTSYHILDALVYWDYECYNAGFITGPEFGCVHWKELEKEGAGEAPASKS